MKYSLTYKEGKVWTVPSTLREISNAVTEKQKVYAMFCQTGDQKWEIYLDCTNEDRNMENTESCYGLGDISADWEAVRTEFECNRLPEKWHRQLEENSSIKEDEKMVEIQEMAEQAQETNADTDNWERSDITMTENTENELPEISENSPYVALVQKDGFQLNMQVCGDMTTMQSDGCKLYLTEAKTGKLFISGSSEITISRARILSAIDHSVMNVLSTFLVNFSENDKKKAYERAKKYLEVSKNITKAPSSRNIQDIFVDIVHAAKAKAAEASICKEPSDDYKYNEQEGTVAIISGQFQKLLDEVDAGCTKTVFCKKLRMVEQHFGETIIISNRGGSGYGFNDTNNKRYYKFNIISKIMGTEA